MKSEVEKRGRKGRLYVERWKWTDHEGIDIRNRDAIWVEIGYGHGRIKTRWLSGYPIQTSIL
jgi:hypothetical protein